MIAESFERIHRSNLVGMGILALRFENGQGVESLGLDGTENIDILGLQPDLAPRSTLDVRAEKPDGSVIGFQVKGLLNTSVEVGYHRNGGILHTMVRRMLN